MDKPELPECSTPDEWDTQFLEMKCLKRPLGFDELIYLARTAPELRIAFDPAWQMGMNRESKIGYYRQETLKLHGIHPHFLENTEVSVSNVTLEDICQDSLKDVDVWDGLSHAVSEVIRDDHPLMPASRDWANQVVGGWYRRPKEKPGPHPLKNSARDMMVIGFLDKLDRINVPITENEATSSGASACHAISAALGGHFTVPSPKSLMNIWSSRSQNWRDISRNA